jgi:hypothetical protein
MHMDIIDTERIVFMLYGSHKHVLFEF